MPIHAISGDLFTNRVNAQAFAQGCNCQGSMGAGIAVGFKERYPAMYEEYRRRCKAKPREFNIGDVFLWQEADKPAVFNLGTQEDTWRSRATYEGVERCLTTMLQAADDAKISSIALPRIGAGYGGLSWKKVRAIIERIFADWSGDLYVYDEFIAETHQEFAHMTDTQLNQISDHVYWMPPSDPYYPSLCAVVGEQKTLMLDAGKNAAHAQRFLDALKAKGLPSPAYIALTHWHFDHFMGASVIGVPVIAHTLTAEKIAALARYDVNDPGHEAQKAAGNHVANTAEYIQDQLADPQGARMVEPSLIVHDRFEIRLGVVTCQIQHVGGDHAGDSCAIYIEQDRVLFLGDCLYSYFIPVSHNTVKRTFPLLDAVCAFDATQYIQGHQPTITTRTEFEAITDKMRLAGRLVEQFGADEVAVLAAAQAQTGQAPDEDTIDFTRLFIAGRAFE